MQDDDDDAASSVSNTTSEGDEGEDVFGPTIIPPDPKQVLQYAVFIGIDPATEPELLWIAEEGMQAPVPMGWTAHQNEGDIYFYHEETKQSMWDHPLDSHYKALVAGHREELLRGGAAALAPPPPRAPVAAGGGGGGGHGAGMVVLRVAQCVLEEWVKGEGMLSTETEQGRARHQQVLDLCRALLGLRLPTETLDLIVATIRKDDPGALGGVSTPPWRDAQGGADWSQGHLVLLYPHFVACVTSGYAPLRECVRDVLEAVGETMPLRKNRLTNESSEMVKLQNMTGFEDSDED